MQLPTVINMGKLENLYAEKLTWFKQNEKPEAVLVIADNPECIKIIVAWTNLDVRCTEKLTEIKGKSENEVWDWLWENTKYSRTELKDKISIPLSESVLGNKMRPLIGNRIIYPDGSVNTFVQRYLREQVARLFEAKSKQPLRKDK